MALSRRAQETLSRVRGHGTENNLILVGLVFLVVLVGTLMVVARVQHNEHVEREEKLEEGEEGEVQSKDIADDASDHSHAKVMIAVAALCVTGSFLVGVFVVGKVNRLYHRYEMVPSA